MERAGSLEIDVTQRAWRPRSASVARERDSCGDGVKPPGPYPVVVIDEVGYIPFESEAANLFFQLVSSRYERASLIVMSNKTFGRWGERCSATTSSPQR